MRLQTCRHEKGGHPLSFRPTWCLESNHTYFNKTWRDILKSVKWHVHTCMPNTCDMFSQYFCLQQPVEWNMLSSCLVNCISQNPGGLSMVEEFCEVFFFDNLGFFNIFSRSRRSIKLGIPPSQLLRSQGSVKSMISQESVLRTWFS